MSLKCHFPNCECGGKCRLGGELLARMENRRVVVVPPPLSEVIKKLDAATESLAAWRGKPCPYCGEEMGHRLGSQAPTRDHVISRQLLERRKSFYRNRYPKSLLTRTNNLLIVCRRCNGHKKGYSLDTWFRMLLDTGDPRAPHVLMVIRERQALGWPV